MSSGWMLPLKGYKGMDGTCEGYLKDFKVNHNVLFLKLDRGSKFIT